MTSPLPAVRRLVTGHTEAGVPIFQTEDTLLPKPADGWPGVNSETPWNTHATPTNDNNESTDGNSKTPNGDFGLVMKDGTSLRYTDLAPGASIAMHRTSSLDYNILVSGKLLVTLDGGVQRLLETPGDLVIQRGTIHSWNNPGPDWTRWATVVVDAKPVVVGGKTLEAEMRM
ncbi:hypothetical protein CERSUDRAFT_79675 [Gelatoporia subvermispora B]|uniref:Cupin 2 conserved barrel domain-containing protein n=1 Tax=Ceriporiopsis subvermispora (strain B) TaxID=914234 RepID=M2QY54_CERS8|nr:hypothetical protein CERSUDRAFT_79675 [Gelatoporia subvermispora B]